MRELPARPALVALLIFTAGLTAGYCLRSWSVPARSRRLENGAKSASRHASGTPANAARSIAGGAPGAAVEFVST